MFPSKPRRPMPPNPPSRFREPIPRRRRSPNPNLTAMFRNPEGNLDLNKVKDTAQQINAMYGQIKPLITTFMKK